MTDRNEIISFMRRFSFATIISTKQGIPIASHLPFFIKEINGDLILTSHFAKANEHWKYLTEQTVMVIFSEPHAYISTENYDKELNVPTWNYLSVHAYGKAELITEYKKTIDLLEDTIKTYEHPYLEKWKHFPDEYKERMTRGIVGFQLTVQDLQGKKKLSQNRTETEKTKIIDNLTNSEHSNEFLIADYMKNE